MEDLISRHAAIAAIQAMFAKCLARERAETAVKSVPAVDAVPVIRCEDCRYWGPKYRRCGLYGTDKEPAGFCDEGLKRG